MQIRGIKRGPLNFSALALSCLVGPMIFNSPAEAFGIGGLQLDPYFSNGNLLAGALGFTALASFVAVLRQRRKILATNKKLEDTEMRLNDLEIALHSDPHLLLIWRGNAAMPERISGSMRGAAITPETIEGVINFGTWLEPDSRSMIEDGIRSLLDQGVAFNIGIKTIGGDLLEADGRAAGGLATLRIRPLSGERREVTELTYDARKLGKQVERLSAVLDGAPFPIWITDRIHVLQWVNQAYVKATGMSDSEAVVVGNVQLSDLTSNEQQTTGSLLGRANAVLNGSMRALDFYRTEQLASYAGFAVDVTEVERAEKELERHINAHTSTLNRLDTAIAIFGPDQRLRFYNKAYVELWNLDVKWLQTQPTDGEILDLLRTQRNLPEQVNFREWRDKQLSIYTTLEPQETYWYLPDGRSIKVVAEQHPFGGISYLYENLTKEIQLESRYNELFGVQRETLDNLAEAVSLFGQDGRLKLFNPAFASFWTSANSLLADQPHIDKLAAMPMLSEDASAAWQDIRFAVTYLGENRRVVENQVLHENRILRYRAVPLPDGDSLVTFADVSDAVKAEQALRDRTEALEAADRLKNSFMANVSYEIRTPLTSIVGFSETLEFGLAGPLTQKQQDYVHNIRQSSDELKSIIDGIIDLSAIDAGALELRLEEVDIASILEEAAEKATPLLTKRQLGVSIEISQDATTMIADPQRLEQILGHLLSNAIGFSPQDGVIRMGARKKDQVIQIWVADTGQGMDPEFQKKAFERFQSKPRAGSHRGPGLGLALVKSFTELHGGQVSLISKLDQGTTVVCTLPISGPRKMTPNVFGKLQTPRAA